MTGQRLIPNRPISDESKISAADKDMLSYVVAFNVPNQKAFALWHPEFLDDSGKLNKTGRARCTETFSYAKNREYMDAYRQTLAEYLNQSNGALSREGLEDIDGDALARKILSDLAAMIQNGRIQDYEILKIATDILNKYGVLKGSEERLVPPVRILPERCSRCRYRACVESLKATGRILDMCEYCKARKYAEEQNYRFNDGKDLLEIPQEVTDELESRNDVRLEGVLSGKTEN